MTSEHDEIESYINEPFGGGVPAQFHHIRDSLNHKFAPVGAPGRKAVLELANLVFALRTEPNPDKRTALHQQMLDAAERVRKMQHEREERHRARREEE